MRARPASTGVAATPDEIWPLLEKPEPYEIAPDLARGAEAGGGIRRYRQIPTRLVLAHPAGLAVVEGEAQPAEEGLVRDPRRCRRRAASSSGSCRLPWESSAACRRRQTITRPARRGPCRRRASPRPRRSPPGGPRGEGRRPWAGPNRRRGDRSRRRGEPRQGQRGQEGGAHGAALPARGRGELRQVLRGPRGQEAGQRLRREAALLARQGELPADGGVARLLREGRRGLRRRPRPSDSAGRGRARDCSGPSSPPGPAPPPRASPARPRRNRRGGRRRPDRRRARAARPPPRTRRGCRARGRDCPDGRR